MILFVASWGADAALKARAAEGVGLCAALFPDAPPVHQTSWDGSHIAWSGKATASPQRVSIIEGVCLDGTSLITEPSMKDDLDGQFAVVDATPQRIEVATDMLGLLPLYWTIVGDAWLVANRVEILAHITNAPLDLEAAASFMSFGWVSGDRTLVTGIRTVPAGARWSLPGKLRTVEQSFTPRRGKPSIRRLGADLVARVAAVGGLSLEAPLTAGLDSRLVFALLRAAEAKVSYVTEGTETNPDVIAGRKLAAIYSVEHNVCHPLPVNELRSQWAELARRLVAQNDGMVSLWQVSNLTRAASGKDLTLTGVGGEICRGFYTNSADLVPGRSKRLLARLEEKASDAHGLLLPDAHRAARVQITQFMASMRAAGFATAEIPSLFYTFERVGRWASANSRKASTPLFAPLATRPFVEAAFSITPARRHCAPLHYGLLKELAPSLHAFPVAKGGWPGQRPHYAVARAAVLDALRTPKPSWHKPVHDQDTMVEAVRGDIVSRCLDRGSSPLWQVVDRRAFEAVMTGPADRRAQAALSILGVATLFEYEAFRARSSGKRLQR